MAEDTRATRLDSHGPFPEDKSASPDHEPENVPPGYSKLGLQLEAALRLMDSPRRGGGIQS